MKQTLICHIPSFPKTYEIVLHPHLFSDLYSNSGTFVDYINSFGNRFVIITDTSIADLYGSILQKLLSSSGLIVELFTFKSGESHKTRETKEFLEDLLLQKKCGKDTCILALGGGVVTDIAGYLAATYCRGVSLIMIPTSLLAMIDASIGGKNGVNTPYGKNLIGTIYPPDKILIDPHVLSSLPMQELKNGIVEMIKHGLVANLDHFNYLEEHAQDILEKNPDILQQAIFDSCMIKKQLVEEDEQENGKRRLLNLGHTIGHALETLSQYSLPHGEAIAIGCLEEAHLAMQLGLFDNSSLKRILKIFFSYSIALTFPSFLSEKEILEVTLLKVMTLDKKSLKGIPRFVTLEGIGKCSSHNGAYCIPIEESLIKNSLEWVKHALRSD